MSEPYFDLEKLKVGDRLWDFRRGWGTIIEIIPFKIGFDRGYSPPISFDFNGKEYEIYNQTLFYDEVCFTPPPRPKRKVGKKVEIKNVIWCESTAIFPDSPNYSYNNWHKFLNKPPMTMTLTWEEDE